MPKSRKRPGRETPRRASVNPPKKEAGPREGDPASSSTGPARASGKGMDRRSKGILIGLMLSMFFLFLVIAWMAPDTTQGDGKPAGNTVLARVVLLLSLLGITYGLLVWDRIVGLVKRLGPKSRQ